MWTALLIDYRPYIQHAIIFGLAIYAWFRGEAPERYAGSILAGMVLLDYAYHFVLPDSGEFSDVNIGHFVNDVVIFVALIPLAMRANRIYPLWLLAAQLISVLMHLNREIAGSLDPLAYWALTRVPSYMQIVVLAWGLIAHRKRVRQFGEYRNWRSSSDTLFRTRPNGPPHL